MEFVIDLLRDACLREILDLIATQNRPLIAALDICADALEPFADSGPASRRAIACARKAIEIGNSLRQFLKG